MKRLALFILFSTIFLALAMPANAWLYSECADRVKWTGVDFNDSSGAINELMMPLDFNSDVDTITDQNIAVVDANDLEPLPHWIEDWNAATGQMLIWTNPHAISASTDFVYIYYNCSSAPVAPAKTSVYNSNFEIFLPFNERAGTNYNDATANDRDGTSTNAAIINASGFNGYGIFPDSQYYVTVGNNAAFTNASQTVCSWIRTENNTDHEYGLSTRDAGDAGGWETYLQMAANVWRIIKWAPEVLVSIGENVVAEKWMYACWSWTGGTGYIWTSIGDIGSATMASPSVTAKDLYIAADSGVTVILDGYMDSTFIYSAKLSDDEIRYLFASQQGSLGTFGSPESAAVSAGSDVNINDTLAGTTVSGTTTIDFDVASSGSEVHLKIYLSEGQGDFNCAIQADLNLHNYANLADLSCDDSNYEDSTNCTYSWDSWESLSCFNDGTAYIDLNLFVYDGNYSEDTNSSASFTFANEPEHDANWFYSITGVLDEENGVSTVSLDFNNSTKYNRIGSFTYRWDRNAHIIGTDQNVTHSDGNYGDLNICYYVTSTYDYNADSWEDGNCMTVFVKGLPQDVNFIWSPFFPSQDAAVDFNGDANTPIEIWNFGFTSPDENQYDQNSSHTFTSSGAKQVCLTVMNNSDLNRTVCIFDINVAGQLNIKFWDENSDVNASPTSLTVSGVDYSSSVDENSLLTLDLNGWATGTYIILASRTGYSEREWRIDLNQYSNYDENYGLVPNDLGKTVGFRIYLPDETTLVTSTDITIELSDNNFIASIIPTSVTGSVSFFVNPDDENYVIHFTFLGTDYYYAETTVTVNIPKDELTGAAITPFQIHVGGLATQDYNVSANTSFQLFSDTTAFHFIDINATAYYERSYAIRFRGGTVTYTLQPYLVKIADSFVLHFFTLQDADQSALGGVLIVMKKSIEGAGLVTVESVESDSAGKAVFSAIENDRYTVIFYYQGALIATHNYRFTENEIYESIQIWDINYTEPRRSGTYGIFLNDSILRHSSPFTMIMNVYSDFGEISSIHSQLWHYDRNLFNATYPVGFGASGINITANLATISYTLDPATDLNSGKSLHWILTVTLSTGRVIQLRKSYTFTETAVEGGAGGRTDFWFTIRTQVRGDLGCPAALNIPCPFLVLIAMFITMCLVGLVSATVHVDYSALSIMACAILGFFVMANWVPFGLWIVLCLAAAVIMISTRTVKK